MNDPSNASDETPSPNRRIEPGSLLGLFGFGLVVSCIYLGYLLWQIAPSALEAWNGEYLLGDPGTLQDATYALVVFFVTAAELALSISGTWMFFTGNRFTRAALTALVALYVVGNAYFTWTLLEAHGGLSLTFLFRLNAPPILAAAIALPFMYRSREFAERFSAPR